MRARGVYSIHRGGDILATHQGKGGIFSKQERGCYSYHTLVEDDLVRVWSIPGQRSCGAEEAGTALGGVPAVPVIIIIIIIIIMSLSSLSSLSLLSCHYHYHYYYVIIIIIIIIIIIMSLSSSSSSLLFAHYHYLHCPHMQLARQPVCATGCPSLSPWAVLQMFKPAPKLNIGEPLFIM